MSEMNFEVARFNMVEQQIRTWEVLDPRVLELVGRMPREDFVPPVYRKLAFADMNIPLGHGQVMMPPKVEARMLQELEISPEDKILEVGTGSGYMTALLASFGAHLYSVEIIPEFSTQAAAKLAALHINNVTLEVGDAARGWDRHPPYDVIAITGSLPTLPDSFRNSLKVGGRLFAIVGQSPIMEAKLIRRVDEVSWSEASLFETALPPLQNALEPGKFVF
ncbi:MAG TPA: protein-L-isoaspartate O-methyltransferase [Acidiferrobacterales bacterium]|nr:protein-L-isoaspartate O-methyltransferase [Acidiferrobacterales bacterium]